MLSRKDYIRMSLELNLFFGRIMKEHLIFMEAAFMMKNSDNILEADTLKEEIEKLLMEVVSISNGPLSSEVLDSGELITPITLKSEEISEFDTGICIDTNITKLENLLVSDQNFCFTPKLEQEVYSLNERAITLVSAVIDFKEKIINNILNCSIFINLYYLLIDHILREAKLYLKMLMNLQSPCKDKTRDTILEQEIFWNTIMGEHALFIRGLLDPTEVELFNTSNEYANIFNELVEEATENDSSIPEITEESLEATIGIRDFKREGTEGIINCQIKSIAYPLLGDHILREANHYIRLLNSFMKGNSC